MIDLKKCPFCGDNAEKYPSDIWYTHCSNNMCELWDQLFDKGEWNTRASDEKLEKILAVVEDGIITGQNVGRRAIDYEDFDFLVDCVWKIKQIIGGSE